MCHGLYTLWVDLEFVYSGSPKSQTLTKVVSSFSRPNGLLVNSYSLQTYKCVHKVQGEEYSVGYVPSDCEVDREVSPLAGGK